MLKKTIVYEDFKGNKREEDHFFNLTKSEITEMEMSVTGGMAEMMQNIVKAQDTPALVKVFKEIILKAYGRPSADGRRFEKSEELSIAFSQTNAYSELFMELATDADKAAAFINGIVPAEAVVDKPALPQSVN